MIGPILTVVLQDLCDATDWGFQVLAGGIEKGGEIKVATYVWTFSYVPDLIFINDRVGIGKTFGGRCFKDIHKSWDDSVLQPWTDYVHLRHREHLIWVSHHVLL